MEQNTVLLSTQEYNNLRDFKKGMDENKFIGVSYYNERVYFVKENDILQNQEEKIKDLNTKIYDLENPKDKITTVKKLEQMNLFSLIKWKLKNRK